MRVYILLFLMYVVGALAAQPIVNINSTAQIDTMSSYLNGIGRNHYVGFTESNAYSPFLKENTESKLHDKISKYGQINNKFASGGKKLYRFGHNISDGNHGFSLYGFDIYQPGWHWASEYRNKGNSADTLPSAVMNVALGAGVHRFFFHNNEAKKNSLQYPLDTNEAKRTLTLPYAANDPNSYIVINNNTVQGAHYNFFCDLNVNNGGQGSIVVHYLDINNNPVSGISIYSTTKSYEYMQILLSPPANTAKMRIGLSFTTSGSAKGFGVFENDKVYSGYVAVVNYNNEVGLNANLSANCPKSRSITLGSQEGYYSIDSQNKLNGLLPNLDPSIYQVDQIGGPDIALNAKIPVGIYEIDYRIRKKGTDAIGHCGYVISVNMPHAVFLRRTQDDVYDVLSSPLYTGTDEISIRNSHRINPTKQSFFRPILSNTFLDENAISTDTTGTEAMQFVPIAYDNIDTFYNEATAMLSDMAIVANIATGYPEELRGLIAYLTAKTGTNTSKPKLAYIELGSELMGYWNKGYMTTNTPGKLGAITRPFAKAVRNNFPNVKVATTSSYNLSMDFDTDNALSDLGQRMRLWLDSLTEGGVTYVDYINIHNYPGNKCARIPVNNDELKHFIAANHVLGTRILDSIKAAINGRNIKFVMTEGNTGSDVDVATPLNQSRHLTMTEGMYLAEGFYMAAKNNFAAFSPFALVQGYYGNYTSTYATSFPTDPNFSFPESKNFDVLFYPNNTFTDYGHPGTPPYQSQNIHVKPAYLIKKLFAEEVGSRKHEPTITGMATTTSAFPMWQGDIPYTFDNLAVFPTKTPGESFYRVLVINRNAPISGGFLDSIQFKINGTTVSSGITITSIAGKEVHDKDPIGNNGLMPTAMADYISATVGTTGFVKFPKFSVSIVKIPVPGATTQSISVVAGQSFSEGSDTAWVTVRLALPATTNVTFTYSATSAGTGTGFATIGGAAGDFYQVSSVSRTIPAGESELLVPVRINNDASTENAEVFNLTIQTASVSISSATAQVTIVDNDNTNLCDLVQIGYANSSIQITGIQPTPILQVQIFDNTNPAQWLLVKDTFYNPGIASVSIPNIAANKRYFVKVRRLQSNYTTEICSKEVELTASSLLQVSVRDTVIVEPLNGTPAVAKVYISIPVINNSTNITVNYTTINETAIGGAAAGTGIDYQTKSGVATILAGRRDTFILVNVYDDPITEPIETFRVKLSSPSANAVIVDSIGVVSIINSDPCTVATMTTTYNSIQVSNFGTSATNFIIQVFDNTWNSVFNQTYTSNPGTVTIPSLLVNKTYYVKVQPYTAAWVPLCATEQYVTIFPTIAITATQSVGEGDGSVTLQICPSAPSSLPIKVKYQTISTGSATSGVDYVAKTDSIIIPALASCASISVTILDGNTLVEPSETFNVVLTNPVNALIASGTAVVTIIDNDVAQPNLKPSIINQPTTSGGQVSMRFRVENTSTTATGVASAVKIYKSTSLPYQTSHPIVYNGTIPALVGLGKDSAWVFFIASSPGTYYYTVVVDSGNSITESNETDNAVTSNVNSALVSNPQVQTPTIQSLPEKEMVLFPNPVKDELHVFLADLAGIEIDAYVINQYGRILRSVTGSFPHQLDFTGLDFAPGLYYVRISSPSVRPRTLKFVVESGY